MNTEFETLIICKGCGCAYREYELERHSYKCEYCGECLSDDDLELIIVDMIYGNNDMNAEEKLLNAGYDGVKYLVDYSYDDAIIGVTDDCRVVYDYDLMIEWLVTKENLSIEEAIDWIGYNTLRALPYMGQDAPIVVFFLED